MMLAEKESVIGAEQNGSVSGQLLAIKLLPDSAHIAIVVLNARVVIFDQFLE
jgi:hypothetical protein